LLFRPIMRATARAITRQSRLEIGALNNEFRLYRSVATATRLESAEKRSLYLASFAEQVQREADLLQTELRGAVGAAEPVRKSLNRITSFVENNLVAAAKTPGALSGQTIGGTPLPAGSSTGTELMAAAMKSASELRLTLSATHEALEAELHDPETTLYRVSELLDQYRPSGRIDITAIRYAYALSTEAMVWAAMLLDQIEKDIMLNRAETRPKDPAINFLYSETEHRPMKLRTTDALRKYLRTRFADEIQRYVTESGIWTGTFRGLQRPSFGPQQTEAEKDDLLVAYLASVADGIPKEVRLF